MYKGRVLVSTVSNYTMVFSAIKNAYTAFRNFFDTHHRTMLKRGVALSPEDEAYLKLAVPKEKTPVPEYTENGARKRKEDGVIEVMSSEEIQSIPDLTPTTPTTPTVVHVGA